MFPIFEGELPQTIRDAFATKQRPDTPEPPDDPSED